MNVIEVSDLVKRFGKYTAVDGISFSVEENEIFGFLGPNGAGKTTTIKMLTTLLRPTSGNAKVAGHDLLRERDKVRQSIGLIFQESSLDENLTAFENLEFHGILYGVPKKERRARIQEMLEIVELTDWRNKLVKTLSGGMKRRLEIARGFIHEPRILFLDEPTLGLDVQTRVHIWEYITNLRKTRPITIFLTTHYMDEAEYADRIAIIDHGTIIALDTPKHLKEVVGHDIVAFTTPYTALARAFLTSRWGIHAEELERELCFEVPSSAAFIPLLLKEAPFPIEGISFRHPTLEDVFLHFTGRNIRKESADKLSALREDVRLRRRP